MASVLDFERYSGDLERELLRRIGYTNGLHKIRRFARVVEYVYAVMPTSAAELAQIIIRRENERLSPNETRLKGKEYALGIIDVAKALLLLERFGPKIALSSPGYACHALIQSKAPQYSIDTFLLHKVIETDGEYTLNILRLVSEGFTETMALGQALVDRFLALIEYKTNWAESNVDHRFSQRTLLLMLRDAHRTLQKAVVKTSSLAEFFFKHTVNPRLEWLQDLGCIRKSETGQLVPTDAGESILKELKRLGGWERTFVFLPLDHWLASQLDIPNLYEPHADMNFSWRLVAARSGVSPSEITLTDSKSLLDNVRSLYSFVKLANFNEADASSVYEVLAVRHAEKGQVLSQEQFEESLSDLVRTFPKEIFKLSKRRGRGLYIALKKSA